MIKNNYIICSGGTLFSKIDEYNKCDLREKNGMCYWGCAVECRYKEFKSISPSKKFTYKNK